MAEVVAAVSTRSLSLHLSAVRVTVRDMYSRKSRTGRYPTRKCWPRFGHVGSGYEAVRSQSGPRSWWWMNSMRPRSSSTPVPYI
jgi:hypothetical protein